MTFLRTSVSSLALAAILATGMLTIQSLAGSHGLISPAWADSDGSGGDSDGSGGDSDGSGGDSDGSGGDSDGSATDSDTHDAFGAETSETDH